MLAWLKFGHPALNQNMALCSSPGVTVHAAVCSVCDPQPGRLHALLSERTDGQVYAHLPGTQRYASVVSCLMLKCPSSQMHGERARNDCECVFSVQFNASHQSSVCRWRMVCVRVARPLNHAPSRRRRPWSSTWMLTVTQSDISWRWAGCVYILKAQIIFLSPKSAIKGKVFQVCLKTTFRCPYGRWKSFACWNLSTCSYWLLIIHISVFSSSHFGQKGLSNAEASAVRQIMWMSSKVTGCFKTDLKNSEPLL